MTNKTSQTSRRKFLKKTAVAGALTTIPAKSVWATGLTNSIVASGHGSDIAQQSQYRLVEPASWISQRNSEPLLDNCYRDLFGSSPSPTHTCSILNHQALKKATMGAILGCKSRTAKMFLDLNHVVLERRNWKGKWKKITTKHLKYTGFFADHVVSTMRVRNKKTKQTEMISHVCDRLAGYNDINKWIVSTMLNGVRHGQDSSIFFPIIGTHNGRQLPFRSVKEFGQELHKKRNHSKTLQQLKMLHRRPQDFHTI